MDTLDDMVNAGRIEPQLAMKVVGRFDKAVADVLNDRVKARMSFKVATSCFVVFATSTLEA